MRRKLNVLWRKSAEDHPNDKVTIRGAAYLSPPLDLQIAARDMHLHEACLFVVWNEIMIMTEKTVAVVWPRIDNTITIGRLASPLLLMPKWCYQFVSFCGRRIRHSVVVALLFVNFKEHSIRLRRLLPMDAYLDKPPCA